MFGNGTISSGLCEARSQAEPGARLGGDLVGPAGLQCHPLIGPVFAFIRKEHSDGPLVALPTFQPLRLLKKLL